MAANGDKQKKDEKITPASHLRLFGKLRPERRNEARANVRRLDVEKRPEKVEPGVVADEVLCPLLAGAEDLCGMREDRRGSETTGEKQAGPCQQRDVCACVCAL